MPTFKQKLAAKKIVENSGNVSRAMKEAGYSEQTARNPIHLTGSKGFKEVLRKAGFNEDFIGKELYKDIKDKGKVDAEKRNRVAELRLGAQVFSMVDKEESKDNKYTFEFIHKWDDKDQGAIPV